MPEYVALAPQGSAVPRVRNTWVSFHLVALVPVLIVIVSRVKKRSINLAHFISVSCVPLDFPCWCGAPIRIYSRRQEFSRLFEIRTTEFTPPPLPPILLQLEIPIADNSCQTAKCPASFGHSVRTFPPPTPCSLGTRTPRDHQALAN